MMKILFLTHRHGDLFIGGVAEVIQHLTNVFPALGVEIIIYTEGEENIDSPRDDLKNGTRCYSGPLIKPSLFISKKKLQPLLTLIQKEKIDLIHAYGLYRAGFMAMHIKKKCGIPFIITSHSDILSASSKRIQRPTVIQRCKKILSNANAVTHLTPIMADVSHSIYNTKEKSFTIPNGIDLAHWKTEKDPTEKNYLLGMGRLEPEKGFDVLIRAYALIKNKIQSALVIAGSGSHESTLKKMTTDLQLNKIECSELPSTLEPKTVYFTGYVRGEQKKKLFLESQLILFATQPAIFQEAFSIVFLETMAAKKALVVSDTELAHYLQTQGLEAELAIANHPESWAEKISLLLNNPTKRKLAGEKNYLLAQKLDWMPIAEQYKKVYEKFIY